MHLIEDASDPFMRGSDVKSHKRLLLDLSLLGRFVGSGPLERLTISKRECSQSFRQQCFGTVEQPYHLSCPVIGCLQNTTNRRIERHSAYFFKPLFHTGHLSWQLKCTKSNPLLDQLSISESVAVKLLQRYRHQRIIEGSQAIYCSSRVKLELPFWAGKEIRVINGCTNA